MGEAGDPTGTEEAMVSLEDLIRVFNGPELLSLLDLVAEKFNPGHASQDELAQYTPGPASGLPGQPVAG